MRMAPWKPPVRLAIAVTAFVVALETSAVAEETKLNGFVLDPHAVPVAEVMGGGPGRDGVRRVDSPTFVVPEEAAWVAPVTPVVGLAVGEDARAYPVHLLEYHQLVIDEVGGVPLAVTYDPLTSTPAVYRRVVDGKTLDFGVSGLIYNCNFLLYDRASESLWSQFTGEAITGKMTGKRLSALRVRQEPLGIWLGREGGSTVMVPPAPKKIDYRYSPYSSYWVSDKVPFPVKSEDSRYHPKELVLGVEKAGASRAYVGSVLTAAGGRIVDEFGGGKIRIAYDSDTGTFSWDAPDDVRVTDVYWFAWKAFHPETDIWNDQGSVGPSS
jgi:hypothetical protein